MASELKHTIAPSGGDFTSLDAFFDHLVAAHQNFVSADVYGLGEISGDWSGGADTTAVNTGGLELDATRYLHIYTTGAARHQGVWSDSYYRLYVANSTALDERGSTEGYGLKIFEGLQISLSAASANYQACVYGNQAAPGDTTWFNDIIARQCGDNSYRLPCFINEDSDATWYIWNTVAYGVGTADNAFNSVYCGYAGDWHIYSSVGIGGKYAFYMAGSTKTMTVKNCYGGATGAAASEDFYRANGTLAKTNCASEDQSADDTGTGETATDCIAAAVAYDADTFVNVTPGSEDFHLAADGLSPLQGVGVDTSGESAPLNFTTDIDGDTISNWSIGADDGPSGATAYTLTCDGGSYALTGSDAMPKRDGKVDASAGSYAFSGQDAGVYCGRAIDADAGAYSLTGADLVLLMGRVLAAEAGTYTLTGQDIALLRAALMAAEGGAYALTGQEAALLRGYWMEAEPWHWDITGQDIAALLGRKIAAEAGAYVLAGQDVTLIYTPGGGAYVLTCEGGAYAITGADAGLLRDARIAADGEAYVVTGQDAATLLGRLLDAGAGAYAVTGTDAALLRAARIAIEAGAYAVTGSNVTLRGSERFSPVLSAMSPVSQRSAMSPVSRPVRLQASARGALDDEPGQFGQGWDAGTYLEPSPIDDDAGGF